MSKVWETMADKTFETVLLRVRSQVYDEAVACPLLNVAHRWWSSVNVTVPINRAVGDILYYTCFGENMMEGAEGMTRTSKGAVECRNEDSVKVWNTTLTLPCTFTCPEAFVKSTSSSFCYGFSNESSVSGIVGASLSCHELHNATLAILGSNSDLSLIPNGQYYTAHTTRNQDLALFPTLPPDLMCDQYCQVSTPFLK
ncbi:uncharacterized protein [Panulirus ornatus]|uniref:uncharacterized protein n=1 Tax=Panulirus ornatus TaxID=150431 RepID=UPI003A8817F6